MTNTFSKYIENNFNLNNAARSSSSPFCFFGTRNLRGWWLGSRTVILIVQIVKDKMPLCLYFLSGRCSKETCPYLHVNTGLDVPVCAEFVKVFLKI